jgi:uncharacterized protein (UPF0248 family)
MFENIIEFSALEEYVDLKEDYPIPTKLNIPDWFKELNHTIEKMTVKGCMPFLDALTSGYVLKMPQDFAIKHNFLNDKNEPDIFQAPAMKQQAMVSIARGLNLNSDSIQAHSIHQLGKCPYNTQNKNIPYHKILNPWKIKTPTGYSCLFTPILNNGDDRFFPLSGIVDTDTFPTEINFPIVINGDKYPQLDTIIKKGTPYIQIIPFKRENWKIKIKKRKTCEILSARMFYALNLLHNYKNKFWNKKIWK